MAKAMKNKRGHAVGTNVTIYSGASADDEMRGGRVVYRIYSWAVVIGSRITIRVKSSSSSIAIGIIIVAITIAVIMIAITCHSKA